MRQGNVTVVQAEVPLVDQEAAHRLRLASLGPQFNAMVKVRSSVYDHASGMSAITFANPNRGKPNFMRLTYNRGLDLYDVEFGRKVTRKGVPEYIQGDVFEGVQVSSIRGLFERQTGLLTSFGTIEQVRNEDTGHVSAEGVAVRPEATSPTATPIEVTAEGDLRAQEIRDIVGDYVADQKVTQAMTKKRTKGQRKKANERALEIIDAAVKAGRGLTEEERAIVGEYTGEGGVGADLNQYHTRGDIAAAVWKLAQRHVRGDVKRALEPAAGSGVFLQTRPPSVQMDAVEIDRKSALVCQALHATSDVRNASFEEFAVERTGQRPEYDVTITNAPFCTRTGDVSRIHKTHIKSADRYFIDTALDQTRAGGVVAMIVHSSVMGRNQKAFAEFRERMLARAEVVDAYRLPGDAFKHTHTEVVSDVIILRKRPEVVEAALVEAQRDGRLEAVMSAFGAYDQGLIDGKYFDAHPKRVLGKALSADETGFRAEVRGNGDAVAGMLDVLGARPPEGPASVGISERELEELATKNESVAGDLERARRTLNASPGRDADDRRHQVRVHRHPPTVPPHRRCRRRDPAGAEQRVRGHPAGSRPGFPHSASSRGRGGR